MNEPKNNPSNHTKVNLIKLSADVHKRDFKICRQVGDQNIQPAQVFEPSEAFDWALKQLESARHIVPIVSVQNRYNLTDRASEDVLEACERNSIGFIPWFPLATGN